nr:MAG TPA: hypothetical protein [Caudoviricetes sp.]
MIPSFNLYWRNKWVLKRVLTERKQGFNRYFIAGSNPVVPTKLNILN